MLPAAIHKKEIRYFWKEKAKVPRIAHFFFLKPVKDRIL